MTRVAQMDAKVTKLKPATRTTKSGGRSVAKAATAPVAPKPSLRQEAYERLRDAILRLELKPGRVTSDSELSRMLGMSRTPVREALTLLEGDLLVTRIPHQGVLIRSCPWMTSSIFFKCEKLWTEWRPNWLWTR